MVQVKIGEVDENKIIANKIFIVNKMIPMGIQRDPNNENLYKILFMLSQNIGDEVKYIEMRFTAEDNFDHSYIQNRPIYVDNIMADESKAAAFKEAMTNFNPVDFYVGDFYFERKDNTNHIIKAYKELGTKDGQIFFERLVVYIPRYMYITLSLFLDNILEPFSDIENPESLFVNPDLRNIRFEKIEGIKLVATCKSPKGETEGHSGLWSYNTHYEANCGPTVFKFNFEIVTEEDHDVKVPLDGSIFFPEYSKYDENFIGMVQDTDSWYIIIYDENKKIRGLRIPHDMLSKTNLTNPYFIFTGYRPTISQEFLDENGNPRPVKFGDKVIKESLTDEDLMKLTNGFPIDLKITNNDQLLKTPAPSAKISAINPPVKKNRSATKKKKKR